MVLFTSELHETFKLKKYKSKANFITMHHIATTLCCLKKKKTTWSLSRGKYLTKTCISKYIQQYYVIGIENTY